MIKTPEEVKKGIKAHEKHDCKSCPYAVECSSRIDPDFSAHIVIEDVRKCRDELISDTVELIAEQEERIAIMSEPDNLGGLFFEALGKYFKSESELISEFYGGGEKAKQAEKDLADETAGFIKRALESGALESGAGNVPVFEIAEGHCRTGVCKDENGGYIITWFATKEYRTPGEVAPPPEMATPVFGYKVRDAKHVRLFVDAFTEIADKIEKHEKGEETWTK